MDGLAGLRVSDCKGRAVRGTKGHLSVHLSQEQTVKFQVLKTHLKKSRTGPMQGFAISALTAKLTVDHQGKSIVCVLAPIGSLQWDTGPASVVFRGRHCL